VFYFVGKTYNLINVNWLLYKMLATVAVLTFSSILIHISYDELESLLSVYIAHNYQCNTVCNHQGWYVVKINAYCCGEYTYTYIKL